MKRTRVECRACLPVAHARLAHRHRPDAGHDPALGQMPVPHHAPAAVVGLQIGGRGQKLGHFRFDRLRQKRPRAIAQNLGQPVAQNSWLNQFITLSLDTAYRSFGGEVEARTPPRYAAFPNSRPHQLSEIALGRERRDIDDHSAGGSIVRVLLLTSRSRKSCRHVDASDRDSLGALA